MFALLRIENIAVIESLEMPLTSGLHVLTGETGAGKSILIDAMNALQGARTSKDLIRAGADKAMVGALFLSLSDGLKDVLSRLGVSLEEDELHISREISLDGRSVCRLQSRPVPLAALKEIGPFLFDIHGQHDGQKLLQEDQHIGFLDSFCGNQDMVQALGRQYRELLRLRQEIRDIDERQEKTRQRIEQLRFETDEIEKADLTPGEEEDLIEQKKRIDHQAKIEETLFASEQYLAGGEDVPGAVEALESAAQALARIGGLSPMFEKLSTEAFGLAVGAKEMLSEIIRQKDDVFFLPGEREAVEERLDLIYDLKSKYGDSIQAIAAYYEKGASELQELEHTDHRKEELAKAYQGKLLGAKELAVALSKRRKEGGKRLEERLVSELHDLEMKAAQFEIRVGEKKALGETGIDEVSFGFSANLGEAAKPLSKIASGGELSRIMLALKKALIAADQADTMIFDEIDAGVSGRAAQKMAEKLFEVSLGHQVICITHLPQLSAMADVHYRIEKKQEQGTTRTLLKRLSDDERAQEIARLLSGKEITSRSLENAKDLLEQAKKYKLSIRGEQAHDSI